MTGISAQNARETGRIRDPSHLRPFLFFLTVDHGGAAVCLFSSYNLERASPNYHSAVRLGAGWQLQEQ